MTDDVQDMATCAVCGNRLKDGDRVCYYCGEPVTPEEEWNPLYERYRLLVVVFFGINLFICLLFNFWAPAGETVTGLVIVDAVLLSCGLFFGYQMREDVFPLFRWKNFSIIRLLILILIAIACAILVNYGVKWINQAVFERELFYYSSFRHLPFPRLTMFLLIALIPAFSEELAYRGIIQSGLLRILPTRQALVITALLFAIIHMSLISFIWLLPFALFLGWIRQKTQTIWYGIVVHFFFNATTCMVELIELGLV